MNDEGLKEVYYHQYCKSCKHKDLKNTEEPCDECLSEPTNNYSHKPIKWEERDKK